MLFQIVSANNHLIIRLDKIDVVRMDIGDEFVCKLYFYPIDQENPIVEYDVTKLTLDQRLELLDMIAMCMVSPTSSRQKFEIR
jgi:hypothetical protein